MAKRNHNINPSGVRAALGGADHNAQLGSHSAQRNNAISPIEKRFKQHEGKVFKMESKGGQRNVVMSKRSCGHLASDVAKGRGGWNPGDLKNFHDIVKTAKYVDSESNVEITSKKPYHTFHIYEVELRGRKSYLKVGEYNTKSAKGKDMTNYEFYALSDTKYTIKKKK